MECWRRTRSSGRWRCRRNLTAPEQANEATAADECEVENVQARPQRIFWARLLKRVFDIDMHTCPDCGAGEMKSIAAILERPEIENVLTHPG